MRLEAQPLGFGELHSLPVVVPRRVLLAELYPPGLAGSALRICDVGLELDSISARFGDRVYVRVRQAQTPVV